MKSSIENFAVFGGGNQPEFSEALHVGRPNVGNRQRLLERFNDILDRRWFTNRGTYVQEFEKKLADFVGVRHAIAVCNATVGMEILTRALGMDGEVIVPAFTFVATAHALQWQQVTPVFCDIDPHTHNIDPARVESLITPRTSGIVGVHTWGRPCDIDALHAITRRHDLRLVFDAAHAFACSYHGRTIGSFGDAEVFSFHATKFLNTFEGGAVVTNNDEVAAKVRLMKNFGFDGFDKVTYIGTNGKMNEMSAAMGVTSLECLDDFVSANRRNHVAYAACLADLPGVHLLAYDETERNNYQYVVAEIDAAVTGITRDDLVRILHAENVIARRYFFPGVHRMEPYRSYFPNAGLLLPETESLVHRVLTLPTGTAVNVDEVHKVCNLVRLAVANGSGLTRRLAALPSSD